MTDPQAVASRYSPPLDRSRLWKAAIKWPMYSVAVMPVLLAAGWRLSVGAPVRWEQGLGFLLAAVLLLLWENLSNDLFDADTGVDAVGKPHSVVALLGRKQPVRQWSWLALVSGLLLMLLLALRSSPAVLALVAISCAIGYLYQGPPFRLGYLGLGEPLCWLAFGPFATAAAVLVWHRAGSRSLGTRPSASVPARPWPRRWCCSVPTSIRWRKTQPTASVRQWFASVRRARLR